jgi:hypothetical protein
VGGLGHGRMRREGVVCRQRRRREGGGGREAEGGGESEVQTTMQRRQARGERRGRDRVTVTQKGMYALLNCLVQLRSKELAFHSTHRSPQHPFQFCFFF